MGVIRKTMSIGTLGMINFRSKKEQLVRARRDGDEARAMRDAEHLAREVAESGFGRVETELRRLSKAEAKAAKQLSRLRRRSRRVRKAERLNNLLSSAAVKDGVETARHTMKDIAHEGAKRGRRARKAARKASHEVRVGAERVLEEARSAMQG